MRSFKLGFMASLGFADLPVREVVDDLARIGYEGISWPLARFDPRSTKPTDRHTMVTACKNAGITITEFVLQQDFIHPERVVRRERLALCIDVLRTLADLNVRAPVNLYSGPAPWDKNAPRLGKDVREGQAWDMLYEALDELVPIAERLSIPLAMEAVFGHLVHDYYTTRELFRRYNSPVLGVNYDPSHGILVGNDVAWAIGQLGSLIFHVHLKDAVGKPGLPDEDFCFPMPGEGLVPWDDFFNALEHINYRWFCTVEFEAFLCYKNIFKENPASAAGSAYRNCLALMEN